MSKYRLPCECGKGIVIDASQAGQQIACECGVLLEVPTLSGVRGLEPVDDATSNPRRSAEWNSSRGMIFAGSLILLIIGAIVANFGYDGLRATPKISREEETETFDTAIDEMSLDEVYETWKTVRERGLGVRGENFYVNVRSFRASRQRVLAIGIALCVGGLIGAIGATLGQRKPSA